MGGEAGCGLSIQLEIMVCLLPDLFSSRDSGIYIFISWEFREFPVK